MTALPIDDALPALRAALATTGLCVLQAPPGAGKTTRVPLDLLAAGLIAGRIVMLEPRRLAARAAAERMAETLGEAVGQTVGYRIRGEAKVSAQTRIEVVTEGILTRMLQGDPDLPGVGCVIFDEFHERSLNADLGLALCMEVRATLRPDLHLIVMSATLDAGPVATLLGAPIVTSEGRAYPVDIRWLPRPMDASLRLEGAVAGLIRQAIEETTGGILVFLPGEGEIRRVQGALGDVPDCVIRPLYGAMDFAAQRATLAPAPMRKIVLATSIAETSLTIPDIRVVIDAGRARRARFDAASGMSRLVTERVTRAEATQRTGRAGRVSEGVCYRLWTKGEEGALQAFPPPEIAVADLTGLALELALWGSTDLSFLTPPPSGPLTEAQSLLTALGALESGRITAHGRALASLPLHPRLAHMLRRAGPGAAPLAALLAERDPLRGAPVDLTLRLRAIQSPPPDAHRPTIERVRVEARRLAKGLPEAPPLSPAQMAALAYPDRIGLRRKGDAPRWVLSGGKGAVMDAHDPMASARLIVCTDLDGDPREARIRQAIQITEAELRAIVTTQRRHLCTWSLRAGRVLTRQQDCYGALILTDQHWDAPAGAIAIAALDGFRALGLPWTPAALRLRARITLARSDGWPDVTDAALMATLDDWLLPHITGVRTAADIRALDLTPALAAILSWDQTRHLDTLVPAHFTTPLGHKTPIDYDGDHPSIAVRLQEMFGLTTHPTIGAARRPLRITLLSPARAPLQTTLDLPRFWTTSYADVRRDMRGAYPRHPWPEDPTAAEPTTRAKPRGT
jgi:ATP-dependent helicase HrpB